MIRKRINWPKRAAAIRAAIIGDTEFASELAREVAERTVAEAIRTAKNLHHGQPVGGAWDCSRYAATICQLNELVAEAGLAPLEPEEIVQANQILAQTNGPSEPRICVRFWRDWSQTGAPFYDCELVSSNAWEEQMGRPRPATADASVVARPAVVLNAPPELGRH